MVFLKEFDNLLKKLGNDYFIDKLHYVPDIMQWAEENDHDLAEPYLPMKLIAKSDDSLVMVIQSEISEGMLADVIKNLGIRWSVKDNVTDMDKKLDSAKKKLAYCFLKEYARSLHKIEGDELSEDEWVLEEMEYLGFLDE